MAVVARTIHAFSFDEEGKDSVQVKAGTIVHADQQIGCNYVCSVGIPGFKTFLVIPASDLILTAEDEDEPEDEESAEDTSQLAELSLGERGEPSREEIAEPEVSEDPSLEAVTPADAEDLEEVAMHKEHLDEEEFDTFMTNKVESLDSPLLQRLHRMISKKNPELSAEEINVQVRNAYEKHADKEFLKALKKEIAVERRPKTAPSAEAPSAVPAAPKKKGDQKFKEFKFPPEALRAIPDVLRKKYGIDPIGDVALEGYEGRFVVKQLDQSKMGLMDTGGKTGYYEVFGDPDKLRDKVVEIVMQEQEEEANPMPVNPRSGMPEITHEGYVIQRQKDDRKRTMNYVFFHPKSRKLTRPGGATLDATKEVIDNYILGRSGLKEEKAVATP